MLDSWIIEEIKQREEEEVKRHREQPFLDLPDEEYHVPLPKNDIDSDCEIVIIQL